MVSRLRVCDRIVDAQGPVPESFGARGGRASGQNRDRPGGPRTFAAIAEPVLRVRTESPLSGDGRDLIAQSEAALREVFEPHEIFTLDAEELAGPNIQFLVARSGGRAVGCVALVDNLDYGEIKRLFVDPGERGMGFGWLLMEAAENAARDIGLRVLRLETGPELETAIRLYERLGYRQRERFGDYSDAPCSMFMEKSLL